MWASRTQSPDSQVQDKKSQELRLLSQTETKNYEFCFIEASHRGNISFLKKVAWKAQRSSFASFTLFTPSNLQPEMCSDVTSSGESRVTRVEVESRWRTQIRLTPPRCCSQHQCFSVTSLSAMKIDVLWQSAWRSSPPPHISFWWGT